jgi:putative Ig domain-containing protein
MKKSFLLIMLACSAFLLNACSGGGTTQPPPPVATHLSVTAPATGTAGTPVSITVSALDASNNVATSYSGTVHFTSTDSQAVLPANSTLTSGKGTFSVTLKTAGSQTITATDTVTASITGSSSSINVSAAGASHFAFSAPQNATTGTAFNFTVTALDGSNNVATSYSGTVHFTSTDSQAVLPANSTLTSGTGSFSTTLKTAGSQTITATDTVTASITGTSNLIALFLPGPLTITSGMPPNGTVGAAYGGVHTVEGNTFIGFSLSATGGMPGYSWTWAPAQGSSVPPGLSISVLSFGGSTRCCVSVPVISGTPTAAGSFEVIVTVTDSASPPAHTSANYTITITTASAACPSGNEKVFAGQYAFLFQGFDTSGPVALAGTFTADGTGGITTGGEEDLNNSAGVQTTVAISSGSYSVGSDNRGCLTITSATTPSPTTATFRFALGSLNATSIATSGRMIEFDTTGTLGSGVIRLQDPTAFFTSAISGNYTFGASSTLSLSLTTRSRFGVVGTFTSAGNGTITAGEEDFNENGVVDGGTPGPITFTGSYTVASDGRGTTTFNVTSPALTIHASSYIVSAKELLFMNTDSQASGNAPFTGTALLQPTGTTFSTSSLSGNSVIAAAGLCPGCGPTSAPVVPIVDVGVMNVTTAGSWTANFDDNRGGKLSIFNDAGTYTVDSMGRVLLTEPGAPFGVTVYLVSPNRGFLLDTGLAVGTGTLEPQSAGPFDNASLKATFFLGSTNQVDQKVPDISAVETFDGVGTVSGTSDTALIGSSPSTPNLSPNQAFNGPYSVTNGTGTPGRVTATGTIMYIISPSKIVLIDAAPSDVYPFILVAEQ